MDFRRFSSSRNLAFSLYEILIVVVILGILSAFAIPQVLKARVRAFAASETENLRIIEAAKGQFSRANPGVVLSSETQLAQYLPGGQMPVSPWGMEYVNVTDLTKTTASPANGMAGKEPPVEPLAANGFNDLGTSGLVYLERLTPTGYQNPNAPPSGNTGSGSGSGSASSSGSSSGSGSGSSSGSGSGSSGSGSGSGSGSPVTYHLEVLVEPPAAATPVGTGDYPSGSTVPHSWTGKAVSYAFLGWTGDTTGAANPQDIVMNSDKTVIANFLDVNKTGPASLNTGATGTYVITVSNNSDISSGAVTMSDTLPADHVGNSVSLVSGPGAVVLSGSVVTWTGTLTPGQSAVINVNFTNNAVVFWRS